MQKITFIDKMNILRDNSINPARMFNHQNNHPFMKYITSSFWIDIRILFQIYSPPTTARKRSISESLEKKYSSDPDWRLAGRVVCPPLSGNRLPWIRRRDSKTSGCNKSPGEDRPFPRIHGVRWISTRRRISSRSSGYTRGATLGLHNTEPPIYTGSAYRRVI